MPPLQLAPRRAAMLAGWSHPGNRQLAGYVMLKQVAGEHPDNKSLSRLLRAQRVINTVRTQLPVRGNVAPEAAENLFQPRRDLDAAREYAQDEMSHWNDPAAAQASRVLPPRSARRATNLTAHLATAQVMGVGNCAEFATASSLFLSHGLVARETTSYVAHRTIDHAWAELSGGPRVVLDAWAKGPAILAEDSAFATLRTHVRPMFTLDNTSGPALYGDLQQMQQPLRDFENTHGPGSARALILSRLDEPDHDTESLNRGLYAETPVLSEEFRRQRTNNDNPYVRVNQTNLQAEIQATFAARSLGANVRQAAEIAPQIIQEAATLLQPALPHSLEPL